MISKYNSMSLRIGIPGIILQYGGAAFFSDHPAPSLITMIVGTILIAVGIAWYIRAKARSQFFLIIGVIPVIGLLVLALLQDRSKPFPSESA